MKAEIVSIGDEILIGQVVNTNASWIGEALTSIGMEVNRLVSIADQADEITGMLDDSGARADLVIMTGGIGPTRDDITKSTLASYFGSRLVHNEEAMERIRELLESRNVQLNEMNRGQAMLPDNCLLIPNRYGTASGMWFRNGGTEYISIPGVPYEMKSMMTGFILPRLREMYQLPAIEHKTVLVQGIPESHLAGMIEAFEHSLPDHIKLAYLPSPGRVRLRLTARGEDREAIREELDALIERLIPYIPEGHFYGYDQDQLEKTVGTLLKERKATLALAESCTGGYIAHMITSVPGSSDYFMGSAVVYANQFKEHLLGVDHEILAEHGAVSKAVVEQMAEGVLKRFGTDYAIAVTGIAGPDGGTAEKPVGTTWIAVAAENALVAEKYQLGEHRGRNIHKASMTALNMLRNLIEQGK